MKKIVVAMLLLLPLIIVASVLLATGVIAHEVYIAVESVELNVEENKTMEIGLSQGSFSLTATVYPTAARNRDVEWSIENVVCFGDEIEEPVTIQDGLVRFSTYCAFDAVVTTVEGRKTARANFYVKCDEMKGLTFTAPTTLAVGDRAELTAVLDPVDAEVYDVEWTSSEPFILEVDKNGILKGKSPGTAEITASAQGHTFTRTIEVTPSVSRFGSTVTTSRTSLTFGDLGVTEATAQSGATVDGNVITLEGDVAELTIGGQLLTIRRAEDGVTIKNADLLKERVYSAGKVPLYVEAVYTDDLRAGTPQAEVTVSEGATEEDGRVTFSTKGTFKVTVLSELGTVSEDFVVVQPVSYVRLNTVDADDRRGIAQESVYGTQEYAAEGIRGVRVPLSIQYPVDADWEDFELTVSHPDLVEVTEDHTLIVKKTVEEPTVVTVSVTAHHSAFLSVSARANRHFTLVDGINCYSYADVVRASSEGRVIALRKDIASAAEDGLLTIVADWYGNGYMLDVSATEKEAEEAIIQVKNSGVLVTNAYIRGDDGVKINTPNGLHGAALWIGSQEEQYWEDYGYLEGVHVEYSILENCYYCAAVTRAEVTFDGCIMRNASNFGVYIPNNRVIAIRREDGKYYYRYIYGDVTVNDCIISDVIAPAIGISTFACENDGSALTRQSTFHQTGFFDVYNWQNITSDAMLGREFLPGNDQANALFRRLITTFLSDELAKSKYDRICYREEDANYIHLGVITSGALNICTTEPTFEDPRFKTFPLAMLDDYTNIVKPFLGHELYRINVYLYEVDENIGPKDKFVADKYAFEKLRRGKNAV
ncbi:MAG: Ig-like domain-containing protein [Clostridia bacterium]|nr:Ig-like domain-containing protein [Clostridia bacterium]